MLDYIRSTPYTQEECEAIYNASHGVYWTQPCSCQQGTEIIYTCVCGDCGIHT